MTKTNFAFGTLAALAFFSASSAFAGEEGVKIDANDPRADDAATVVCKRTPPPIGSRTGGGKKICKTNAAWRAEREATAQATRESQDRSSLGNTRTGG